MSSQLARYVIGISGATGAAYAVRLLEELARRASIETHVVVSEWARTIISHETELEPEDVEGLADHSYRPDELTAPIASGSFATAGMLIVPCSMKTLSAVANSYAGDLISRAADVTLKEGRPLLLLVQETPLHLGHLRLMARAAEIGATVFPPLPVFYGRPKTIEDLVAATVGRALARIGLENDLYQRWQG
jgi:4-hydroxy-3-polyprenylbenzoate decarboxylase